MVAAGVSGTPIIPQVNSPGESDVHVMVTGEAAGLSLPAPVNVG